MSNACPTDVMNLIRFQVLLHYVSIANVPYHIMSYQQQLPHLIDDKQHIYPLTTTFILTFYQWRITYLYFNDDINDHILHSAVPYIGGLLRSQLIRYGYLHRVKYPIPCILATRSFPPSHA